MIIFRYKKLCDFCFICGKLDHIDRDCPSAYTNESDFVCDKKQYDSWLKADSLKGVSLEEINMGIKSRGKKAWQEVDKKTEKNGSCW